MKCPNIHFFNRHTCVTRVVGGQREALVGEGRCKKAIARVGRRRAEGGRGEKRKQRLERKRENIERGKNKSDFKSHFLEFIVPLVFR